MATAALAFWTSSPADTAAKTPGKTYCFLGKCHRVLTLSETRAQIGRRKSVVASYYSDCSQDRYNPCGLTSSGTVFHPSRPDNAASPIYPNGTKLLVWNPRNKLAVVVRIDNAGPYWGNRTLDLSRAAADRLAFRHSGVGHLIVKVIYAPTRQEARYRRRRVYAPVPGYIGRHDTLDQAFVVATAGKVPAIATGTAVANLILPVKNPLVAMASIMPMPNLPVARPRAFASIALPVKNIYVAEHRAWLASLTTAKPATLPVATLVAADGRRTHLPAKLARAGLSLPLPLQSPLAMRRRFAALDLSDRSRSFERNTPVASRRLSARRKAVVEAEAASETTRRHRSKKQRAPQEDDQPSRSQRKPRPANKTSDQNDPAPRRNANEAVDRRTATAPAVTPTFVSQPKIWRRKYFGMNPGGA